MSLLGQAVTRAGRPALLPALDFAGHRQREQQRGYATLKEIQLRLKSIKNISKITESMKMIATTKLTRAQRGMEAAQRFGSTTQGVIDSIQPEPQKDGREVVFVVSSDRGLCGGIHSSVSKATKRYLKSANAETTADQTKVDGPKSTVVVIGDKARSQMQRGEFRSMIAASANQIGKEDPNFATASGIVDQVLRKMGGVSATAVMAPDAVKRYAVMYNTFQSMMAYQAEKFPMFTEADLKRSARLNQYEVEDEGVLQNFAEFQLATRIYHAMAEGHASELAARRTAMENATRNAGDIIDKLTITYNRTRQAAITNELVDIVVGASAQDG